MSQVGLWGNWYEQTGHGWEKPRRAFICGVPSSSERAGLVHLAVFSDPERDAGKAATWTRKGVTIAAQAPTNATPAEPTQEGRMGLFVLDPLPGFTQTGSITPNRRRAVKS